MRRPSRSGREGFGYTGPRVHVAAISASVEILRDAEGIPHVRAGSAGDAFFGQGWVHAQDRLFQLATLRRDGFGYLSRKVVQAPGHCITTTVPASKNGYRLRVNVDGVSDRAPLTVELLDKLGRPLPAFSGTNAAKITEPGVSREVVWPAQRGPLSLRNQPFAVQLSFPDTGDVRFYAVYAAPVEGARP